MQVAFFSAKPYDEAYFTGLNTDPAISLSFFAERLSHRTAALAKGYKAICAFTNDVLDRQTLSILAEQGTRFILLRCAGYNNVDLEAATDMGISVARVPAYSPYAVAEHTVGMMLTLNRKFHKAYNRVREGNFTLNGLLGFDLHGKVVGIIGTGQIGLVTARILGAGFGCKLLAYDPYPNPQAAKLDIHYVELSELLASADIITLHCPLTPHTRHLIGEEAISRMKTGVMLINTSRGGVIDATAVIKGLKSGKIGYLGLDVYEEESDVFFEDLSGSGIPDDTLARLLTFPNVLITSHQAFFTNEALSNIARTTLDNLHCLEAGEICANQIAVGLPI